jgi:hypothetical protein
MDRNALIYCVYSGKKPPTAVTPVTIATPVVMTEPSAEELERKAYHRERIRLIEQNFYLQQAQQKEEQERAEALENLIYDGIGLALISSAYR